tara:strand:+ start:5309 stop:5437 length:129 start_codon:yes stop_codon:yes gene_type:complete
MKPELAETSLPVRFSPRASAKYLKFTVATAVGRVTLGELAGF